jgi:diamine N-acetyltransferase
MAMHAAVEIRLLTFNELQTIQDLAFTIWPIAYRKIISKEQISFMLDKMYSTESLHQQFYEGTHFLLAEQNNEPIGFAAFNFKQHNIYRLEKLYVLPDKKGIGLGKTLLQAVVQKVHQLGGSSLQLNVNRKNDAVQFYEKMGFTIIDTVDIAIGEGFFMNDYIMELLIS